MASKMINKSSQKIFNNSLLYSVGTVFSKAIGFFLIPIYTHNVSDADYGIATTITMFVSTFGIVVMLSLRAALIRFYNEYDETQKKDFVGTITAFVITNALIICTLLCLLRKIYTPIFFKELDFYPLVFWGVISLGAEGVYLVYQSLLQAQQDGKKYSINSILYLIVHAILVLIFVWAFQMGALGIVLSNCITNILFAICGVIVMLRTGVMCFSWNRQMLTRSLKYSLPILPHNLSSNASTYATKLIINNYIGYVLSGMYSLAAQFSTIIALVQSSINLAFRPWFIEQMKDGQEGRKQIKYMSVLIMAIYSFVAVLISSFCKEIVVLMTEASYVESWKMVPFFVTTQLIAFIYYSHVQALMYNIKMSKYTMICSLSGLVVNVIVAVMLVGPFNIYGVLIANFASQTIMATLTVMLSRKAEKVDFGLPKMILYVFLAIILSASGMFISWTSSEIRGTEILLKLMLTAISFMVFIFPYRIEVLNLIKGLLQKKI